MQPNPTVQGAPAAFEGMVGTSPQMRRAFELIDRVGARNATVLIRGARGTGKELAARAVHQRSERRGSRFAVFDCVAKSCGLETELFGRAPGSLGTLGGRPGLLEAIDGGTLLLDEVADLGLDDQARLLRMLDVGEVRPLGSNEVRRVDVRVIATTRRHLHREVAEGRFREDLYYRLDVLHVDLPLLRERIEDVPLLVRHFLEKHGHDCHVDPTALEWMETQPWPGNVSQLEAVIQRSALGCQGKAIDADAMREASLPDRNTFPPLRAAREAFEQRYVESLLERVNGNLDAAANIAGMPAATFQRMLRRSKGAAWKD